MCLHAHYAQLIPAAATTLFAGTRSVLVLHTATPSRRAAAPPNPRPPPPGCTPAVVTVIVCALPLCILCLLLPSGPHLQVQGPQAPHQRRQQVQPQRRHLPVGTHAVWADVWGRRQAHGWAACSFAHGSALRIQRV